MFFGGLWWCHEACEKLWVVFWFGLVSGTCEGPIERSHKSGFITLPERVSPLEFLSELRSPAVRSSGGCVSTQKGVSISIKYFAYYINLAFRAAADNLVHGSSCLGFVWLAVLAVCACSFRCATRGKLIILSPGGRSDRLASGPDQSVTWQYHGCDLQQQSFRSGRWTTTKKRAKPAGKVNEE